MIQPRSCESPDSIIYNDVDIKSKTTCCDEVYSADRSISANSNSDELNNSLNQTIGINNESEYYTESINVVPAVVSEMRNEFLSTYKAVNVEERNDTIAMNQPPIENINNIQNRITPSLSISQGICMCIYNSIYITSSPFKINSSPIKSEELLCNSLNPHIPLKDCLIGNNINFNDLECGMKRKRESNSSEKCIKKRMKFTSRINSRYTEGKEINKGDVANEEQINGFKEFEKCDNICFYCENKVSIRKLFKNRKDNNRILCLDCAKRMAEADLITLTDLGDYFEDENIRFDDQQLYKCKRLKHSRPITHYIKQQKMKDGKYAIVTCCCFCRLIKVIENLLKNKRKS